MFIIYIRTTSVIDFPARTKDGWRDRMRYAAAGNSIAMVEKYTRARHRAISHLDGEKKKQEKTRFFIRRLKMYPTIEGLTSNVQGREKPHHTTPPPLFLFCGKWGKDSSGKLTHKPAHIKRKEKKKKLKMKRKKKKIKRNEEKRWWARLDIEG